MAHLKELGIPAVGTQTHSRNEGLIHFDLLHNRLRDVIDPSFLDTDGPFFAAICGVVSDMDRCLTERDLSHKINVENTIRLVDDCLKLGIQPIFFSTCFVFDGHEGYYAEDHAVSPANEYGRHKAEVEQYLKANAPGSFIIRMNKVLGTDPKQHHLLSEFYSLIAQRKPIVCIQDLWISPTCVQDVVRAIVVGCQQRLTGIYHIANSEFFTRDELARQFCFALGVTPQVVCKPLQDFHFKDNRALRSYLDGSKFVRATGMRYTTMREAFAEFIGRLKKP
jgi:dTDP-4-dehydrorhamnose reductase